MNHLGKRKFNDNLFHILCFNSLDANLGAGFVIDVCSGRAPLDGLAELKAYFERPVVL